MNRIKNKCFNIFIVLFLIIFFSWLIGGTMYNVFFGKFINEKIDNMYQVIYNIRPINQYELKEVKIRKSRAIISKSLGGYFYTEDNPNVVMRQFKNYLEENGWDVVSYRENAFQMEARSNTYIFNIELDKHDKLKRWNISIKDNDIFSRFGL